MTDPNKLAAHRRDAQDRLVALLVTLFEAAHAIDAYEVSVAITVSAVGDGSWEQRASVVRDVSADVEADA